MGGGGSSGPTQQQTDLQTEQALTNANLNLEENDQRKTILNAMQGTRVFRGSALSRAVAGNTAGGEAPAGSSSQPVNQLLVPAPGSLFDNVPGTASPGSTPGTPGAGFGQNPNPVAPGAAAAHVGRG